MFKSNQLEFLTSPLHHRRILYFLLFIAVFSYFLWLNSTPVFPDPDSFYHAKIIELIRDAGPIKNFPWLPFTTLSSIFIDHHFLYHLLLVPFVFLFNPLLVVKLAAVFFATLAIVIFQWFLDRLEIKYSFLYTLILLLSDKFIFRLNLAKVPALSLIFILLTLYFIFKRPAGWNWPLFCLSFFYVWLYGGWPILLGIGFIYFVIYGVGEWLAKTKDQEGKKTKIQENNRLASARSFKLFFISLFSWSSLKLPLSIFSGLLAGLIISPYFPRNLQFYWQQTFQIGLINYRGLVDVGGEWYPLNLMDLIGHNIYGAIFFLVSLVLFFVFLNRQHRFTWLLFFLSAIFLTLTLKSQRNIEYFVPLALIFSALVFEQTFGGLASLKIFIVRLFHSQRLAVISLIICFVVCLPIIFSYNFFYLKKALQQGFKFEYLSGVGDWLKKNTEPRDLIFHDNWADFPILFYRSSANYYLIGLDPTFMYFQDQEQYLLWRSLVKGEKGEQSCELIDELFGADYAFIAPGNKKLITALDLDRGCVKVYEDADGKIYSINVPTANR